MITIYHFIILAIILFSIGFVGVIINTHNLIIMLLSVEIMLLASNLLLTTFSFFTSNIKGQVAAMFFLAISAAEMAIALSIVMLYFKRKGTISINQQDQMRE
jgi:NADH-quinone oxidoreductase subunit K